MISRPNIPTFKKKVISFISKEEGKISKENIIKAGIMATVFSFGAVNLAKSVSGSVQCNPPDNHGLPVPGDVTGTPDDHNSVSSPNYHSNQVGMTVSANNVVATHNHGISSCHSSHSSHGSHGSHCSWMC